MRRFVYKEQMPYLVAASVYALALAVHDYVFGRTDKPEGVKYNNQPIALIREIENTDEFRDFIEACFDPRSPMNSKLKEMLFSLAEKPLMSVAENGVKYGQDE